MKSVKKMVKAGKMNAETLKKSIGVEVEKSRKMAEKEIAKVKKQLESTLHTAENYIKGHPEKAAMVAAGIGAALGSALTLFATRKKKSAPKATKAKVAPKKKK